MARDLYIQCNSPGEVSNWLEPICNAVHKKGIRVTVLLTYCQYATGQEKDIAMTFLGVKKVYEPKESYRFLVSFPWRIQKKCSAVLFLGGEPLYSRCLSWKFKVPLFGYAERPLKGQFERLFLRDIAGDLMASKFRFSPTKESVCNKYGLDSTQDYCLIFPGSRKTHFRSFLPYLSHSIKHLNKEYPDINVILNVSPFINEDDCPELKNTELMAPFTVLKHATLSELAAISKLLVTIPGSNTMEAAYNGLPMIVFLPLNKPDALILDGGIYWVSKIPIIGRWLKQFVIAGIQKRACYFALPNIRANKSIVPEYCEHVSPEGIASKIAAWFYNEKGLDVMKKNFLSLSPKIDVAKKIAEEIDAYI